MVTPESDNSRQTAHGKQERPWLLPTNHKLRHLQGISLRNLNAHTEHGRRRGKTIDDDALPYTLRSPTKALAERERKLEHAHSSENLRSATTNTPARVGLTEFESKDEAAPRSPQNNRPTSLKPRRRSTLEWAAATPQARQQRLRDAISEKLLETFVSLHIEDADTPFYVSEQVDQSMQADFRLFSLEDAAVEVRRSDTLTIKLWVKKRKEPSHRLLMQSLVHLPSLAFMARKLEDVRQRLPVNSVIFHMTDGVYCDPSRAHFPKFDRGTLAPVRSLSNAGFAIPSAAYDTLMRLSTLDECIQDAFRTRHRIAAEINDLLCTNEDAIQSARNLNEGGESLKSIRHAISTRKRLLEAARTRLNERRASLDVRLEAMKQGRLYERQMRKPSDTEEVRFLCLQARDGLSGQRRRVCEDLLSIYAIEALPGHSLAFTIQGLRLPNSGDLDDNSLEETAAAFGLTARAVTSISIYLSIPLPYLIHPQASTSSMEDPISIIQERESRVFPLYSKGSVRYRFEYGVFLLNKNIEILLNTYGLRVMDIRQTLPNLKYLLYVATAGQGELPARKAGGIRGLLRGGSFSPGSSISREGSADSTRSNGSHFQAKMRPAAFDRLQRQALPAGRRL